MTELDVPTDLLEPDVVSVPPPSRWQVRVPELGVFALALVTNLRSLSVNGWGNTYYAAAVRSMTGSWTNFFFASFDPGGWVTVDKPPLAWWSAAASAKVFGFNSWSILAPSAVAGALAVWLLTFTVRRVWGRAAGLVAGAALATMPAAVAVSRSNNPDVWLVLGVVAAAWALERAVATGRLRWAAWMGVFVGLGFLAKLGAALIVVPALWFAYLVASRGTWKRRLVGTALASVALAAVSFVWIGAAAIVPSSSRPFIGGSTDGTAWNLVVGYNGLGRVTGSTAGPGGAGGPGGGVPGGLAGRGGPGGGFGGSGGVNSFGGATGIGRLFNMGMGDQVMWLVVLASAAALGATWLLLRRKLDHTRAASLVAWGGWAATSFVTFSYASGIYHNYYVSLLAPAVAALVGIGAGLVLRSGRTGRILAAAALLGSAVVQVVFLRRLDELTALRIVVPTALLAAALVLVLQSVRRPARLGALVGVGVAAGAALLAPTAWSLSSLGHASSGTFPEARPRSLEGGGGPGGPTPNRAGGAPVAGPGGFGGGLDADELAWLRTQRTKESWLVAVSSSMQASSAIIAGDSVMAIGGFSGSDPTLTNAKLSTLVRDGRLRFVTAGGAVGGPGGPGGGSSSVITATVTSVCTNVPATTWGGAGTSTLYDCAGKADAIAASPTAATATADPAARPVGSGPGSVDLQQVQACMAEKGFAAPANGPPRDAATIAALKDCGLDLTATGGGPGGPPPNP